VEKEEIASQIDRFYRTIFPSLQYLTSPRPQVIPVVEALLDQGWDIVIATNPLFPRLAIEHRLAWAGLPVSRFPYTLVTSYESMHFAKPHTEYYAEILARIGWPHGPVIMVGNNFDEDLLPSAPLGIPGFWMDGLLSSQGLGLMSASGGPEKVLEWITDLPFDKMEVGPQSLAGGIAILRSTLAVLHRAAALIEQDPGNPNVIFIKEDWCQALNDLLRAETNDYPQQFKVLVERYPELTVNHAGQPNFPKQPSSVDVRPLHDFLARRKFLLQTLEPLTNKELHEDLPGEAEFCKELARWIIMVCVNDRRFFNTVQTSLRTLI
jgi:hypothetical protein